MSPNETTENSPAFQRRVAWEGAGESRMGRLKAYQSRGVQPSLRDLLGLTDVPGVETPGYFQMSLPGQSYSGFSRMAGSLPASRLETQF